MLMQADMTGPAGVDLNSQGRETFLALLFWRLSNRSFAPHVSPMGIRNRDGGGGGGDGDGSGGGGGGGGGGGWRWRLRWSWRRRWCAEARADR